MVESRQSQGSATQSPTAVRDYIQEIVQRGDSTQRRTEFMNLFQQLCVNASRAGVSEQQLLDNIHEWYSQGQTGQTGGTGSTGGSSR